MAKKISKKVREQRRARYGMRKIEKGADLSWVSIENKHGWSLGLQAGNRPIIWLKNTRFASLPEVKRALKVGIVVKYLSNHR